MTELVIEVKGGNMMVSQKHAIAIEKSVIEPQLGISAEVSFSSPNAILFFSRLYKMARLNPNRGLGAITTAVTVNHIKTLPFVAVSSVDVKTDTNLQFTVNSNNASLTCGKAMIQLPEHIIAVANGDFTCLLSENEKTQFSKLENDIRCATGVNHISGGFTTLDIEYLDNDSIYISVKHGVVSDCSNYYSVEHYTFNRKTQKIE